MLESICVMTFDSMPFIKLFTLSVYESFDSLLFNMFTWVFRYHIIKSKKNPDKIIFKSGTIGTPPNTF